MTCDHPWGGAVVEDNRGDLHKVCVRLVGGAGTCPPTLANLAAVYARELDPPWVRRYRFDHVYEGGPA